jgi:oxygen-independent coproporphyrinogen-3 oxidase
MPIAGAASPPGIYIHIPFCRSKCLYCDFLSFPAKGEHYEAYTEALKNELKMAESYFGAPADTVYVGGGTPTALPINLLASILEAALKYAASGAEVTVEANPATISRKDLSLLRQVGANRISMGMQAAQDHLLEKLGRAHTFGQFMRAHEDAVEAGFDNISLDAMFGLPGQTAIEWEETIKAAISLNPPHVSAYSLAIEEGTPFHRLMEAGAIAPMDEEADRAMFHWAVEALAQAGIRQYEISNFAVPGFESRHNSKYWKRCNTFGFGLGAHSFWEGRRWSNARSLEEYLKANGCGTSSDAQMLSEKEEMEEFVFLGLRLNEGISFEEFFYSFGTPFDKVYARTIKKLEKLGVLEVCEGRLKLTDKGRDVSNTVLAEFLLD